MLNIKVVGGGCANCKKLAEMCQEVVKEQGIEAEIEKVTDYARFPELGIYVTPGLLLNDQVASSGKIPVKSTLARWIADAARQTVNKNGYE
jgi:small redox-active disulfide protein 2